MAITRAYEEHEVTPELRRLYCNVRTSFDLPFVPTLFKLMAGIPEYLRRAWDDLGPVCRSKEFQAAARAFQELAHSTAVSGGWTFSDQSKVLAAEKFSNADMRVIGGLVSLFHRAMAQGALFARLMQRGYSGGQKGRVSASKQVSASRCACVGGLPTKYIRLVSPWNPSRMTVTSMFTMSPALSRLSFGIP